MQATCTNLQKAAGNVHEINLQRSLTRRGEGVTHETRVLLIQHDIARKMQKLDEGQLALHLLCRLLQQKSESGLNVFVRIRQRFHTCSSSTAGAAARRGGRGRGSALMAVVQWHKMPIRISSSQSVGPCAGIADALGAVCSFPSLRLSLFTLPCIIPFTLVGLFANANCLSPPGHFINFTARARPESSSDRTFDFHVRFVVVAIPCTLLAGYAAHLIAVYMVNLNFHFSLVYNRIGDGCDRSIG